MQKSADLLPRFATKRLDLAARTMPVVLLTGARQTGKSTLARFYTGNAPATEAQETLSSKDGNALSAGAARYVTLDSVASLRLAREDPDAFVRQAPTMVIDEVQREPDLLLAIKAAVDE